MLRKANNVFSVVLSDVNVLSSTLPAAGTVVTSSNLPANAVVLTDAGLRLLDNATPGAGYSLLPNGAQFYVIQGRGTTQPLMKSPILTKGKVNLTISKFKPAQQQSTAVGFNGTTGALPVANNTNFFIKIRKRDNDAANRSQPFSLFAGPVRTDATGTQAELASLLVSNGWLNFKDEPANYYLRFEALCDNAGAVPTGTTTTFTATNGSNTVAINGTLTNVAVGDYIRLEGAGVTNAVYLVTAYTASTSIVLDSPYVGTTGTYAIANVRRITAATAATANFGVRMTGNVDPFDVNQWRDYYANRFTVSFSDTSTLITHLQGAFNGNGVWQQVAMDEYLSYGYEGENNQLAVPSIPRDQTVKIPGIGGNTDLTSKYSCLNIAWEESISGLVSMDGGKGNVVVYLNLANSGGSGVLPTTPDNCGETFVVALGLTAGDFNQ
jgi:hypothetical protein